MPGIRSKLFIGFTCVLVFIGVLAVAEGWRLFYLEDLLEKAGAARGPEQGLPAAARELLRESHVLLAAATGGALLLAVLASVFLSRAVLWPIDKLTAASRAVARGDFARRVRFRRRDEFGELGAAFDKMLDAIQAATVKREELEALIAARTAEKERIFTLTPDMLCVADFSGRFLRVNSAFAQALGYSVAELTARPFREFIHPEDIAATEAEMEKFRATGEPTIRFENRYRHRDGSWRILSWSAVPLPKTGEVFAAAHDVTEVRAMEAQLRELNATLEGRIQARTAELAASEERFRLMVEQVRDHAIFLLDPEGRVAAWNAGAERLTGYSAAEIVGRPIFRFQTPRDQASGLLDRLLREARAGGEAHSAGWRVRKDGTRFWTEGSLTAIRDSTGRLRGYAGVTRDLTERRVATLSLKKALRVQRELTRRAQAGEKAKSEFFATMSHEVRTPMNGILGYADLLAESGELTGPSREYVEILRQSAQALLRILDDILDFSKIEAGALGIEKTPFDARELLEEARLLVLPAAARKNLEIAVHIPPDVPSHLTGDAGRLRQVLLNLAGNAVKFTDRGTVTLGLEPAPERPGGWWELSVSDTGPGLSEEQQARLFKPFAQGDTSSTRRNGGTGLGLAISKRLVELMGGALTLESAPGKGSRFTARLPLPAAPAPAPAAKEEPAPSFPAGRQSFARLHPLRILVAEDDAINRKLMLTLLQKLGYHPIAAANGREAVAIAARERPNCILMDLQMPEMDGFEAAAAIRKSEAASADGAPIYICALTANTDETDRGRCFAAGMSAHVNKPIRKERLCAMLAEASRAAVHHDGGGSHTG